MGLLDGILGGGGGRRGMSPITMALMGLLAYRTFKGKGRLADMLGTSPGSPPGGPLGGLFGGSGGSGGSGTTGSGATGSAGSGGGGLGEMLSKGLNDLVGWFKNAGQSEKADSWVSTGPNKALSAAELEQTLGPEKIAWLMEETGMSREELLAGLSRELPEAVNKLTPEGRIPTGQEAARFV